MKKTLHIAGILIVVWWLFLPKWWAEDVQPVTFYVKEDNTPVYACPEVSCEVLGTLITDNSFDSNVYDNYDQLPEWVAWQDGFIEKSSLYLKQ